MAGGPSMSGSLDVLLGTYNGGRFLGAQIHSLFGQTDSNWRVLVRDDGSTDNTITQLALIASEHPDKIRILPASGHGGVVQNYSALLQASDAPYAMFCDQDDLWHAEKISRSMETMHALEDEYSSETPLLVHTAARVIEGDKVRHASFHRAQGVNPKRTALSQLLVQNSVLGCTVLMNRALVQKAFPIPADARMHDQWVALVAAAIGRIGYVAEPCVDYRQHANNAVGMRKISLREGEAHVQETMHANTLQAKALLAHLGTALSGPQRDILRAMSEWPLLTASERRAHIRRYKFKRATLWQNLAQWWWI